MNHIDILNSNQKGHQSDHVECYLTTDKKYVLISSPYPKRGSFDIYINLGWLPYKKLYGINANTYLKVIPMRQRCKKSENNLDVELGSTDIGVNMTNRTYYTEITPEPTIEEDLGLKKIWIKCSKTI